MMGAVDIIPAKHILCLVAQILAGRVTVTDVPVPLVLLVGTVNSLMRIVAATYSTFQGRDDDVNAASMTHDLTHITLPTLQVQIIIFVQGQN